MKKFFAAIGILLMFAPPMMAQDSNATTAAGDAAAAAPAAPKDKKAAKTGDEAGIKKMFSEVSEAWAAGDAKAVASHWLLDGSLINPFGQAAWSRAEVEQVVNGDLQMMKGSTQTFDDFHITFVLGGLALVDTTGTVAGGKNADGTDMTSKQFHVYAVVIQRGKKWLAKSVRPYAYLSQPSPSAENALPAAGTDASSPSAASSMATTGANDASIPALSTMPTPGTSEMPPAGSNATGSVPAVVPADTPMAK